MDIKKQMSRQSVEYLLLLNDFFYLYTHLSDTIPDTGMPIN